MKRLITTVLSVLLCITAGAQTLSGSWKGKLSVGGMVLNIVLNIKDSQTITMDSPDQGAYGIPMQVKHLSTDSVCAAVPALHAEYAGRLAEGVITGRFTQGGMGFDLTLTPGTVELNRPQTPKPPFPYSVQEISFDNNTDNVKLSGTLTLPKDIGSKKSGDVPVVMMVSGSGLQDRDEQLFGYRPFAVIADYLARHGIASLRYDDRGCGKSTGDGRTATTLDFMRDALSGTEWLRTKGGFKRIGVLGHSEGGTIAFMLGARKAADFIVSMAGATVPGDSLLIEQNRILLSKSGVDRKTTDGYCKILEAITKNKKQHKKTTQPQMELIGLMVANGITLPEQMQKNLLEIIKTDNPWLNSFLSLDPTQDIRETRCPVMALNGERDTQVPATANLNSIRMNLPANTQNMLKQYPGLNHLFQPCTTGLPTEYGQIEQTISEEVLRDIAEWVNRL